MKVVKSTNFQENEVILTIPLYFHLLSFCNCFDQWFSAVAIFLILTSLSHVLTIQIFALCKMQIW